MCLKKDFKVSGGVAAKFHLREIRNQIQLELQIEIHNEICCGNTKKYEMKINWESNKKCTMKYAVEMPQEIQT